MHERFRGFSEEFRLYMYKRSGFPSDRAVRDWLRKNWTTIKSGVYNNLKHGDSEGEVFIHGFVAMLTASLCEGTSDYSAFKRSQTVLWDFLRDRGVQSPEKLSQDAIVAHIAGPITDESLHRSRTRDYLRGGLGILAVLRKGIGAVEEHVQGCSDENGHNVDEAVRWLYIQAGQSVSPDGPRLSEDDAIAAAAAHMRMDLEDYQRRARMWHDFNPWTVVFAREEGVRAGVTIVLPLTDIAYMDIRKGRRASYDMTVNDFASPTCNIALEACAETSNLTEPHDPNPTELLLPCLGYQIAALTQARELAKESVIRAVSFAGTTRNRERLLDSGYQATGTRMPRTGIEIYEHLVPLGARSRRTFGEAALLMQLCKSCNGPPPL